MAKKPTKAASHPTLYYGTVDPNVWQECDWDPIGNQYVCHDIPASQVPKHATMQVISKHVALSVPQPRRP
jgi:hypothetical protein